MAGGRWLEGYGGETTQQLLQLEGECRIDSLVVAFEEALQGKAGPLSHPERCLLAVEALEREVNNGGYGQFFTNSSCEFVDVIEEALRLIGCPRTADITRDAIAALGIAPPLDGEKAAAAVLAGQGSVADALAACDDRYFGNDEPIADRLFAWIKEDPSRIRVG